MNLFKNTIRRCYKCNKFPCASFPDIYLDTLEGLKIIEKNLSQMRCRIGCCGLFYEGQGTSFRQIVKLWNAHTVEDDNELAKGRKSLNKSDVDI